MTMRILALADLGGMVVLGAIGLLFISLNK
jgi:hypothetical protein